MGFLSDIQAMPNEYDYSRQFFERYYRPQYTTIIVAGPVDPKNVHAMVDERWGQWKGGDYKPEIPAEPAQDAPRSAHVDWPNPTLPWVAVAYRGPAYSDSTAETAALDAISQLGFSRTSPLYQKLVIQDQIVDAMYAGPPTNLDPELFGVIARVKKPQDLETVQKQIIAAAEGFAKDSVDAKKLEALKEHLRYEFALGLNNSEAIAQVTAQFVALRRTPETINRYYDLYAKLTPEDIQRAAAKYLVPNNRNVVTLASSGETH
jgi:zinc protease